MDTAYSQSRCNVRNKNDRDHPHPKKRTRQRHECYRLHAGRSVLVITEQKGKSAAAHIHREQASHPATYR
eukprot:scaffold12698_cov57-Attheya_sp.AAC.2